MEVFHCIYAIEGNIKIFVIVLKKAKQIPTYFMEGNLIIRKKLHPVNDFFLIKSEKKNLVIL